MTSDKKTLRFSIPLDKKISTTVEDISFSSRLLDIRKSDGGYLLTNVDIADYFTVLNVSNNYITFQYNSASAFSGTNNTPISVSLWDLQIAFN